MDSVAKLSADQRRLYFEQAAARLGRLTPQLIEKDFWVCWLLKRIFELPELGEHMTFKGGTSLSKVFRVIERFSEDIDLSIERTFLGFSGDNEPEQGATGKEQQRLVDALRNACQDAVANRVYPQLKAMIAEQFVGQDNWSLTLDANDPESQTILFHFPPAVVDRISPYFAQSVRVEFGARSDHFPVSAETLSPYLSEAIPQACKDCEVTVRVLAAERTFWEKATILHVLCHRPSIKPFEKRQSRHFYDLFQLANHAIGQRALQQIDLLLRVAAHKRVFFKSAAARYDEAKPGTLRLIPSEDRHRELTADYTSMRPMFFRDVPAFDVILDRLRELENTINIPSR